MSREDPPMRIRLPVDLKRRVQDAAEDNKRSMNAEIVSRLEASFRQPKSLMARLTAAAKTTRLDDLEKRVAALEAVAFPTATEVEGDSPSMALLKK
jgi:hypothetical protein